MKEKIIDAGDKNFLSDVIKDLPSGMFNKVVTGCGATSVALNNDVKYVIAMPYVSLIKNKTKWSEDNNIKVFDLCGICNYSGKDAYNIGTYFNGIEKFDGNKIITTYDSLETVTDVLVAYNLIDEWSLMVDESHQLVKSAGLRWGAVSGVIESFRKYKKYVFVTATPIKDEHQIEELVSIPKVKMKWNNLTSVKVNYEQYQGNLNVGIASLVQRHISDELEGNAHIFINSVTAIVRVLKSLKKVAGINQDNINVVCSQSNPKNEVKLRRIGYPISDVGVDIKKVNFYTSTAFEGCDIIDKQGKTYIISNGSLDHTKIDITTILPQIIGRVRNSKYKNHVDLLYTSNAYLQFKTEKEFIEQLDMNIASAKETIDSYNAKVKKEGTWKNQKRHKQVYLEDICILENPETGLLVFNKGVRYSELSNYQTMFDTYSVSDYGLDNGIQDGSVFNNSITYDFSRAKNVYPTEINKGNINVRVNYTKLCKEYYDGMTSTDLTIVDHTNKAFNNYPEIVRCWKLIGADGFKACSFEIKKIRDKVKSDDCHKIKAITKLKLKIGDKYPNKDLKIMTQIAYDKSNLNIKAKASDIYKVYNAKPTKVAVNDKRVRGIEILSLKD
jgi:hypothetical protein